MTEKKPNPKKLRPDVNEVAHRVMQEATGEAPRTLPPSERQGDQKNPEAAARGKKGGKARAKKLTPSQREEISQVAALARWKKKEGGNS